MGSDAPPEPRDMDLLTEGIERYGNQAALARVLHRTRAAVSQWKITGRLPREVRATLIARAPGTLAVADPDVAHTASSREFRAVAVVLEKLERIFSHTAHRGAKWTALMAFLEFLETWNSEQSKDLSSKRASEPAS